MDIGSGVTNESEEIKKDSQGLPEATKEQISREMVLTLGTVSATEIPCVFFKVRPDDNVLGQQVANIKRQSDDKIGEVDCYVFLEDLGKTFGTKTLWIGKQDFLIHQIKSVRDEQVSKPALDDLSKKFPNDATSIAHDLEVVITETHTDIVLNGTFVPADFSE